MYIQTPPSPSTELVLEEEGGVTVTLKDRFLPYLPLRVEGKQRAEFTWYPGSPEATVQMLGPEEGAIRINGFWKDKFFELVQNVLVTSDTPIPVLVTNVAELVATVDTMRRMGRRITLNWGGLRRVGHITSFTQTWHNFHDVEWDIEFSVLSQGETTVPSVSAAEITLPSLYSLALKTSLEIQQKIIDGSGLPTYLAVIGAVNNAMLAGELLATATAGAIGDVARGYANGVFSVTQGTRRVIANLTSTVVGLGIQANTIADTATSEALSFGIYGGMDNAPIGAQLAANSFQRTVSDTMRKARYSFADSRRLAARQAAGEASKIQTYTPPTDTDLRTISVRYYNTDAYWQDLMIYNGLQESRVPQGALVSIPPTTAFSDKNSTRSG